MNTKLGLLLLIVFVVNLSPFNVVTVSAQDEPAVIESSKVKSEVVAENLASPADLCINPKTNDVYLVEKTEGRVSRIVDGKPEPVVTGFDVGQPLAIEFVNKQRLLVVFVETIENESKLAIALFNLENAKENPLKLEAAKTTENVDSVQDIDVSTLQVSLIKTNSRWIASTSDANAAFGFDVNGEKIADIRRLPTEPITNNRANSLVVVPNETNEPPNGYQAILVSVESEKGTHLAFIDEYDGYRLARAEIAVENVVDLTYSSDKHLFALIGSSAANDSESGVFKIVKTESAESQPTIVENDSTEGEQGSEDQPIAAKAEIIVELEHPAAMAFDSQGNLLVTLKGDSASNGQLVKVSGLVAKPDSATSTEKPGAPAGSPDTDQAPSKETDNETDKKGTSAGQGFIPLGGKATGSSESGNSDEKTKKDEGDE